MLPFFPLVLNGPLNHEDCGVAMVSVCVCVCYFKFYRFYPSFLTARPSEKGLCHLYFSKVSFFFATMPISFPIHGTDITFWEKPGKNEFWPKYCAATAWVMSYYQEKCGKSTRRTGNFDNYTGGPHTCSFSICTLGSYCSTNSTLLKL